MKSGFFIYAAFVSALVMMAAAPLAASALDLSIVKGKPI